MNAYDTGEVDHMLLSLLTGVLGIAELESGRIRLYGGEEGNRYNKQCGEGPGCLSL